MPGPSRSLDDFLALGLIALAYGLAHVAGAYAFLAAFAAGLGLRVVERRLTDAAPAGEVRDAAEQGALEEVPVGSEAAVDHHRAAAWMASAVLGFSELFERIGAMAVVVLVGALLSRAAWTWQALWFVPMVLLVIRPVSVWVGLWRADVVPVQRTLIAWFGMRGIGSVYYLMFAETHGLPDNVAATVLGLTLTTITASIFLHGTSVTPVMNWYRGHRAHRGPDATAAPEPVAPSH